MIGQAVDDSGLKRSPSQGDARVGMGGAKEG